MSFNGKADKMWRAAMYIYWNKRKFILQNGLIHKGPSW